MVSQNNPYFNWNKMSLQMSTYTTAFAGDETVGGEGGERWRDDVHGSRGDQCTLIRLQNSWGAPPPYSHRPRTLVSTERTGRAWADSQKGRLDIDPGRCSSACAMFLQIDSLTVPACTSSAARVMSCVRLRARVRGVPQKSDQRGWPSGDRREASRPLL